MTNTTAPIEIANDVLFILEQPCTGGGINEKAVDNTVYDASIIYEF